MADFASCVANIVDYEPGTIMVLSGLSKVEMNGCLVEIQHKLKAENGDETVRWKCIMLKDGNEGSVVSINAINLQRLPAPSASLLKKSNKLCFEAQTIFRQVRNGDDRKLLDTIAKVKLNEALALVPQNGMAYNTLGDIAHFTGQPQIIILKHMRRAVANGLNTPDDDERVFKARVGYSGALGNMGDFNGEQKQLKLMLSNSAYTCGKFLNFRSGMQALLGGSLFNQGKLDEALEILRPLRDSKPVLGRMVEFGNQSVDEMVDRLLLRISFQYYENALAMEKEADQLTTVPKPCAPPLTTQRHCVPGLASTQGYMARAW